jgi:hypothetical protein
MLVTRRAHVRDLNQLREQVRPEHRHRIALWIETIEGPRPGDRTANPHGIWHAT